MNLRLFSKTIGCDYFTSQQVLFNPSPLEGCHFFFFFSFPSLVLSGSIHFSGISAKFARDPGWDAEDPRISHFFAPLTMQQVRGLAGCRQNSPPRAIVMTATVWLQNKVVEDTEELGGERCHRERIKLSFFDCCGDINFVVLNGIPPTN